MSADRAALARARSREAQGLPPVVTDQAAIEKVAAILRLENSTTDGTV